MNEKDTGDIGDRVEYRGTGFYLGLAAILVFAAVLLVLAVQNTQDVSVTVFGSEFSMPLFGVAIGAGLLAVVLDELIGLVWRRQRRSRLQEQAELDRLRQERHKGGGRRDSSSTDPSQEGPAPSATLEEGKDR